MKIKYLNIVFFFFFVPLHNYFCQPLTTSQSEELSAVISQELVESGAPGAVFAIVKEDSIIFQKAFGVTNIETQQPMTTETVFVIASVTKFFTALALLTSLEEKNIEVNTSVGSIIQGLSPKLSSLTIDHLLSHSSGMIDWWKNTNDCKEDMHEFFLKVGDEAIFENQGAVFSYSNNGYTLAGLVLAELEGISYSKSIDKIIIKPLQMTSTTFSLENAVTHSLAIGHQKDQSTGKMKPTRTGYTSPTIKAAGGLFSNITDLAKLAICFYNNGIYDNEKVINPKIILKMSTGYATTGESKAFLAFPNTKYSFGSYVFRRKGINYVANAGEALNSNSLFVIAPDKKTAFIALSNTGLHPFAQSIEKAMDLMFPEAEDETEFFAKENNDELIGKYYLPNIEGTKDEIVEILQYGNDLQISFSQNNVLELVHSGNATYTYKDPSLTIPLAITFFRDKLGKVKYLNIFWRTYIKLE